MKIEKVNDHQIRCTLTKADLADRQLKLSELAYGTEKARDLFRDMMQQASVKFGFEADDIPLMIEAVPLNGDCIVLIITKVEDPEELDTRFSKFAPSVQENEDLLENVLSSFPETADEVLDLFKRVKDRHHSEDEQESYAADYDDEEEEDDELPPNFTKMYSFASLGLLTPLARQLNSYYDGENSLFKDPRSNRYYLSLCHADQDPDDFNRVCNALSEYGRPESYTKAHRAFMEEHYELLISGNALDCLARMEASAQ